MKKKHFNSARGMLMKLGAMLENSMTRYSLLLPYHHLL